ncbi:MJ0042-type zinc finger domain-containing protein [Acinetobacter sp. SAAs470]|uniref:MJ0042-type zinc finger domain-containing protein n=1 Tax=unclassified Acinetobacter TaxID=196816 RepID=UPI003977BF23
MMMPSQQTQCPRCLTIYRVNLTPLKLAIRQGMVCCPKCLNRLHTLHCFIHTHQPTCFYPRSKLSLYPLAVVTTPIESNLPILDIFTRQTQYSQLSLEQYLNHLSPSLQQKISSRLSPHDVIPSIDRLTQCKLAKTTYIQYLLACFFFL